jgi:superfamily I DNA/RNA helicase
MVSPQTQSLLVLYDDTQSIYQGKRRAFNFASVGVMAQGRTSILRMNYRNTAEVLALAMHCAHSLLEGAGDGQAAGSDDRVPQVLPTSAGRRGPLPVLIEARHAQEEAELLAERLAAAQAAGTPLDEMAVLCRTRAQLRPIERALQRRGLAVQSMAAQAFRHFDWQRPSVKLLTLHSAKGLEFACVAVAGLHMLPMRDEPLADAVRLLYVGMTRATHTLLLTAHGASPVVDRVREALARLAAQAAGDSPLLGQAPT